MGAIANTIAIVVIVCVGYLIIKKVYPTAVLMIAGLVLLCCAVLLDVEPGLALKKGTGSEFFDIFKIILFHILTNGFFISLNTSIPFYKLRTTGSFCHLFLFNDLFNRLFHFLPLPAWLVYGYAYRKTYGLAFVRLPHV